MPVKGHSKGGGGGGVAVVTASSSGSRARKVTLAVARLDSRSTSFSRPLVVEKLHFLSFLVT